MFLQTLTTGVAGVSNKFSSFECWKFVLAFRFDFDFCFLVQDYACAHAGTKVHKADVDGSDEYHQYDKN